MTAQTAHPADNQRDASIESLLEGARVRPSVKHRARRISAACDRLTKQSRPLTIPNITGVAKELYPDDDIAPSTIWNKTPSGEIYRAVVDAWKVWLLAKGHIKSTPAPVDLEADISDSLLNRIEPREARLIVLLMRGALRNAKSQLNGLRSLTSDRLIRPGVGSKTEDKTPAASSLSKADLATIASFIDENELRLRGFIWGQNGELTAGSAQARSGPGVRDALLEALRYLKPETRP